MKMISAFKIFIVSSILLIPNLLSAETVLVAASGGCQGLHILSVYQHGSDVLVTKFLERRYVLCHASVQTLMASIEMDYPSIALKEIEVFRADDEWSVLWQNGKVENSYNPDFGTGWVDSQTLGLIFIRLYPWVFHPELGWLFIRESAISNQYELSFWFHSPEHGWMWKTPSMDRYYHHDSGTFREFSSFVILGSEFNLSFNQEVTVVNEYLKIQFSEVNEDSRCPVDVICAWAGRLVVTLKINNQDLELSIGGESEPSKTIGGYRLTLTEVVAPVPRSDEIPKDSDYKIRLLVEKGLPQ